MAILNSDGTNPVGGGGNSVAAKVAAASAGDTVTIPAGTFTWTAPLNVGKNIILRGPTTAVIDPNAGGTVLPVIKGSGINTLIHYTCENTSGFTAEIANLELYGDLQNKVIIDGISTIRNVANVYSRGMKIHDVRWKRDPTLAGDIHTAGEVTGLQFRLVGWVFGVMYHCEVVQSLNAYCAAQWKLAHNTGVAGETPNYSNSNFADYSYISLPPGRTDLAGSLDMWVFEDCIFRHVGALTDCPGDGFQGVVQSGARYLARHNTFWGSWASHGTRDSGTDGGRGMRIQELYNNHFVRNNYTVQSLRHEVNITEMRDGENVHYNNYTTLQTGGSSVNTAAVSNFSSPNPYGHTGINASCQRYAYGSDGLNPWDNNAKADFSTGAWTDPEPHHGGAVHYVHSTYNRTSAQDPDGMFFHGWTHGQDFRNRVINGVDDDNRYSDVFGILTNVGTYNTNPSIMLGATIQGRNLPPLSGLTGYFDGFVLRNPNVPRTQFSGADSPTAPGICFKRIKNVVGVSSNATGGLNNGTSVTCNIYLEVNNQSASGNTNEYLDRSGSPLQIEVRRVVDYFSANGMGADSIGMALNSSPAILNEPIGAPAASFTNPRFNNPIPGGVYSIGNRLRVASSGASTPFIAEADISRYEADPTPQGPPHTEGVYRGLIRGFHHLKNAAHTYSNTDPDMKPGYPWDGTIGAGNPSADRRCKIGADWSNMYVEGTYTLADNDVLPGATTPEFASFYVQGAVNSAANPYPHVLRETPSGAAPAFTYTGSTANFAPGVDETFNVTADGAPDLTVRSVNGTVGGSLPTGVTFTDIGGGVGHLRGDTNTVAGVTHLVFRAVNATATTDSASFTLTIDSPTVALVSPAPGQTLNVSHAAGVDAVVSFKATASALSGINKVEFYEGTNKLDTETTTDVNSQYVFTWSGMVDGTYTVKARAYDAGLDSNDSLTATVVVSTNVVVAPPAPASINVRA